MRFFGELSMKAIYSTTVDAVGGRNGTIKSVDGQLALQLAIPASMGGTGGATNPEELFAGGYAACFGNAVIYIARSQKLAVSDNDVSVRGTVSIGEREAGGFGLAVELAVTIRALNQDEAERLVAEAEKTCPYSNAVRGNIDVKISVTTT